MNKKGQSINLYTIGAVALIFGVAMVILAVTSEVIDETKTSITDIKTTTSANETFYANGTVAHAGAATLNTNILNGTAIVLNLTGNGQLVEGVQYTLNKNGAIGFSPNNNTLGITADNITGRGFGVTYQYQYVPQTGAFNTTVKGSTGLINLAGQQGNVGTVIGAAVIIGVLLAAFAFYKFGGGVNFQR